MKRSKHNLSYTKLFSCDMGELIPAGVTEVLPGDTLRINTNALVRAAALLSPVMHPVNVRIHHWFVPNRLIWDNWEKFITGGPDGLDASVHPTITVPGGGFANGSLADCSRCFLWYDSGFRCCWSLWSRYCCYAD